MAKVFTAKYNNESCAGCGDPIYTGDAVAFMVDELYHEECHPTVGCNWDEYLSEWEFED